MVNMAQAKKDGKSSRTEISNQHLGMVAGTLAINVTAAHHREQSSIITYRRILVFARSNMQTDWQNN